MIFVVIVAVTIGQVKLIYAVLGNKRNINHYDFFYRAWGKYVSRQLQASKKPTLRNLTLPSLQSKGANALSADQAAGINPKMANKMKLILWKCAAAFVSSHFSLC